MAAPPQKAKDTHRKRFFNGKEVKPILCVNRWYTPKYNVLGGAIDGEVILSDNGVPIPFKEIGELK